MSSTRSPGALYAELGRELFQFGRYEEAAEALRKAAAEEITDFPGAEIYLTLGRVYSALGKNSDALSAFEEAVRLDPNTFHDVEREISALRTRLLGSQDRKADEKSGGFVDWLKGAISRLWVRSLPQIRNIALNLVENKKFAEAERLLKSLALVSPDDAEIQENLGWALLKQVKQQKIQESIAVFRKAIDLDSSRPRAYQGLGEGYQQLHQNREAAEALRRSLELDPEQSHVLLLLGVILRDLGELGNSEQTLTRVAELQPQNEIALYELAITLKADQRQSEAADALTRAAHVLVENHAYREAERRGKEAISLDSSNVRAHLEVCRAQMGQKLYEDALKTLNEISSVDQTGEICIQMALAHFFLRDSTTALQLLDRALLLSPGSAEAMGLKGMILNRLGRPEEALKLLDAALAQDRKQSRFLAERGAILEVTKDLQQAVSAYRDAIEADPGNRWTYNRLGLLLFGDRQYEAAADALSKALTLPPDDEAEFALSEELRPSPDYLLHLTIGKAWYYLGQYEKAVSACDEALNLDSTSSEASYHRGLALSRLGRHQDAVAAFQLAIDLNAAERKKERADMYAEMGEALRLLARYREAKTAFKRAITLEDNFQWALARYGDTLRMLRESEESVKCLREALKLNPNDGWVWGVLGAALLDLKHYRSALEALDKAISHNEESSFTWGCKGKVLRLVRRFEKAIEAFEQGLKHAPDTAWILVENGIAMREVSEKGNQQALPLLRKATELDPNTAQGWYQLAVSQCCLGNYGDALDSIQKGTALEPGVIWVNTVKSLAFRGLRFDGEAQAAHDEALSKPAEPSSYVERGANYMYLGDYSLAAEDFKQAVGLDPNFADGYNNLAWVYLWSPKESPEKAIEPAKRAVDLTDSSDANMLDTLGWVYYKKGDFEDARQCLERAAALAPEDLEIHDHLTVCLNMQSKNASSNGQSVQITDNLLVTRGKP